MPAAASTEVQLIGNLDSDSDARGSILETGSLLVAAQTDDLLVDRYLNHLLVEKGLAAKTLEAEYEVPFQAHACMEPLNCTVHDQGGRAEIWTGTQNQTVDRNRAAEVLGINRSTLRARMRKLGILKP